MSHADHLEAEAATWLISDGGEKLLRERMRHHRIVRDLLLDRLPTHRMDILEVGGGPLPVSDLLEFRSRVVVDPCTGSYQQIAACPDHVNCAIEHYVGGPHHRLFDLAIATNSLDHVASPPKALQAMSDLLRPGGYLAVLCAENNAFTHPHPAHEHNLTADDVHRQLDVDYETVWELTYERDGYRYGWVPYQGKRGQPAFALLLRKCAGYA